MGFEVVAYGPERRAEVETLLRRLWGPDPETNWAHWTWRYDRNPYDMGRVYVALDGTRLVGMRGFIGARWRAGPRGEEATVLCAGDTVVHPDYEGRGAFRTLMEGAERDLFERGHRFLFNFSAGPAVRLRSLRLGWRAVGAYEAWGRRGTAGASGQLTDAPFARLDDPGQRRGLPPGVTVSSAPRPEEMAALVERATGPGPIRHVRDATFFRWRFENPLSSYRFVYAGGPRLDGYVALRVRRIPPNPTIVQIVDWEAMGSGVLERLLDTAHRLCGAAALEIWAASLAPEIRAFLAETGFAESRGHLSRPPYRRGLLVRRLNSRPDAEPWILAGARVDDPRSWDLRTIWSDGG